MDFRGMERWLSTPQKYVDRNGEHQFSGIEKNNIFFDFGYDNRANDTRYIHRSILRIDKQVGSTLNSKGDYIRSNLCREVLFEDSS